MSEKQNITNEGPAHKYFHMMLNIADDDLDPFEYRLLGHFVRVTNGGETLCQEGIRTTAAVTRMSVNKVRAARVSLRMKGYIGLTEPSKEETQRGIPTVVKLLDRWADNIARYNKNPVSNSAQNKVEGVSNITQVKPEPVLNMTQGGVSNLTPKKNTEIEDKDISTPSGAADHPRHTTEEYNAAIKSVWPTDGTGWLNNLKSMLFGTAKKGEWAKCKFDPPVTDPAEIVSFGEYARHRMKDRNIPNVPTACVTIQRWFYDFRAEQKRKLMQPSGYIPVAQRTSAMDCVRVVTS